MKLTNAEKQEFLKLAKDLKEKGSDKKKVAPKDKNKVEACCPANHKKVKDKKDHFPLETESQAKAAFSQVKKLTKAPAWWTGSLDELVALVQKKIKTKYKKVDVSLDKKKSKKADYEAAISRLASNPFDNEQSDEFLTGEKDEFGFGSELDPELEELIDDVTDGGNDFEPNEPHYNKLPKPINHDKPDDLDGDDFVLSSDNLLNVINKMAILAKSAKDSFRDSFFDVDDGEGRGSLLHSDLNIDPDFDYDSRDEQLDVDEWEEKYGTIFDLSKPSEPIVEHGKDKHYDVLEDIDSDNFEADSDKPELERAYQQLDGPDADGPDEDEDHLSKVQEASRQFGWDLEEDAPEEEDEDWED